MHSSEILSLLPSLRLLCGLLLLFLVPPVFALVLAAVSVDHFVELLEHFATV